MSISLALPAETVVDRRFRRSDDITRALAYQCAFIQEQLALDAMIVADAPGTRWVGAGDKTLCRLLSRSAAQIADGGGTNAALRMEALRAIKSDLTNEHITTFTIGLPGRREPIYVAGVGGAGTRATGVSSAARGTRRILGYDVRGPQVVPDAGRYLQELTDYSFIEIARTPVEAFDPSRFLFFWDDSVYRGTLEAMITPARKALERSGALVDGVWRGMFRSSENAVGDGVYCRTFRVPVREPRSRARLGTLKVSLFHRHDRFELPCPPQLELEWLG